MKIIENIPVWNVVDESAFRQIRSCINDESVAGGALMADHHKGYSMPIGGVVAYRSRVSPSGVGYDISCGNKAIKIDAPVHDIRQRLSVILDDISSQISFGVGRHNKESVDNELFDDPLWNELPYLKKLKPLAMEQLGTVGAGNHFVDILTDQNDSVWIANHFGSRGFGHKIASGFLNLAHGRSFDAPPKGENMDAPPTVFELKSNLGSEYWACMNLAGRYAYAGRNWVLDKVLTIIGAKEVESVHNHHNYAWEENHRGEKLIVIRKGATPAFPGQKSFIGGSMGDNSVIVEGVDHSESKLAFYSTVHGAGRVLSRRAAAGRWIRNKKGKRIREGGQITRDMMFQWLKEKKVEIRGGSSDESPHCYKRLNDVLREHQNSLKILYTLKPIGVVMAGDDVFDPYAD